MFDFQDLSFMKSQNLVCCPGQGVLWSQVSTQWQCYSLAGKHFLAIEKFMSLLLFFQNWKIALLTLLIKVKLTVLMSNEETLLFLQLYFDKTREKTNLFHFLLKIIYLRELFFIVYEVRVDCVYLYYHWQ